MHALLRSGSVREVDGKRNSARVLGTTAWIAGVAGLAIGLVSYTYAGASESDRRSASRCSSLRLRLLAFACFYRCFDSIKFKF